MDRLEATVDEVLNALNALAEAAEENLGAVQVSKKDNEPTLYY